jgi:hypothetical protein
MLAIPFVKCIMPKNFSLNDGMEFGEFFGLWTVVGASRRVNAG